MAKDAFYFSHDSNARNDLKCMRLRRLCGMAGYGLYWCVIEMLRDASEFRLPLAMREDIVYELRADDSHFAALIDCGLLEHDDQWFWSESLCRRMSAFTAKREQARNAGRVSAQRRCSVDSTELNDRSTTVEHPLNDRSTTVEPKRVKESKVKERVGDNIARSAKPSRAVTLVDDDFLESLKENSAFDGIDIDREHGKMLAWLQTPRGRGKQPTRARFLSWLNRCNPQDRREEPESYITCNTFEDEHGNLR